MKITTTSAKQTFNLGLKLAKKIKKGAIFALIGDLGGGKTEFTKGLAYGLGIKNLITSPTFVLLKVYRAKHQKIRFFCHVDAYRIKKSGDHLNIGLMEFLDRPDCVVVVEWADKVRALLKSFKRTVIHFAFCNPHTRIITITKKTTRE